MRPGTADSQGSCKNPASSIREALGSQTFQPPLKPCFLNFQTGRRLCEEIMSTRSPLGGGGVCQCSWQHPAGLSSRGEKLWENKHTNTEKAKALSVCRGNTPRGQRSRFSVLCRRLGILRQMSILNPKVHLGVANMCS